MFIYKISMFDTRTPKGMYGLIIGGYYGLVNIALGRITGGSMNPARYFGPALVVFDLGHCPIYFLAPLIGVFIGGVYFDALHKDGTKKITGLDVGELEVLEPNDTAIDQDDE